MPRSSESDGGSSDRPAPTASFAGTAIRTSFSHFMTATRLARACWPVSQGKQVSGRRTCRGSPSATRTASVAPAIAHTATGSLHAAKRNAGTSFVKCYPGFRCYSFLTQTGASDAGNTSFAAGSALCQFLLRHDRSSSVKGHSSPCSDHSGWRKADAGTVLNGVKRGSRHPQTVAQHDPEHRAAKDVPAFRFDLCGVLIRPPRFLYFHQNFSVHFFWAKVKCIQRKRPSLYHLPVNVTVIGIWEAFVFKLL